MLFTKCKMYLEKKKKTETINYMMGTSHMCFYSIEIFWQWVIEGVTVVLHDETSSVPLFAILISLSQGKTFNPNLPDWLLQPVNIWKHLPAWEAHDPIEVGRSITCITRHWSAESPYNIYIEEAAFESNPWSPLIEGNVQLLDTNDKAASLYPYVTILHSDCQSV